MEVCASAFSTKAAIAASSAAIAASLARRLRLRYRGLKRLNTEGLLQRFNFCQSHQYKNGRNYMRSVVRR